MHARAKKPAAPRERGTAVPIFGPRQTFGIDTIHYKTVIDDTLRHRPKPLGIRTDAIFVLVPARIPPARALNEPFGNLWLRGCFAGWYSRHLDGLAVDHLVNEAELARAHDDPRFKQVLLARSLEQLLDMLYRKQHLAYEPAGGPSLAEGAPQAVRPARPIRALHHRPDA